MAAHDPHQRPSLRRWVDALTLILPVKNEVRKLAALSDAVHHVDKQIGRQWKIVLQRRRVMHHLPG